MAEISRSTIAENATKPKRVKGDEGEVEQFSIAEQIAADKHNQNTAAARSSGFGLRVVRVKASSALGQ